VERLFTPAEAQALLDETVRPLAERMVAIRQEWRPLQVRWQRLVIAIGSNGGGLDRKAVQAIVAELVALGVQVKDLDRGLLDFPAQIEGGDALLCWHVGEERIGFWHRPEDGFAGRRPL
jgi:hypothetical protein